MEQKQNKKEELIGIIVAFIIIIILIASKVLGADFVTKNQIVPYDGILLTESKAKLLLQEHYELESLKEKTMLQDNIIEAYQKKASETTIYIGEILKERDQYKTLFKANEKSSRWNWVRNVMYFMGGVGTGFIIEKIIKSR